MLFYRRINRINGIFHAMHFDPIIIKTINSWSTKQCYTSNPIDRPNVSIIWIFWNRIKFILCDFFHINYLTIIRELDTYYEWNFIRRVIPIFHSVQNFDKSSRLWQIWFQHMYYWFLNNRNSWMVDKLESYTSHIKME